MRIFNDLSLEAMGRLQLTFIHGTHWDRLKVSDNANPEAVECVNLYTSHQFRDKLARAAAAFNAVMAEPTGPIIAGEDECDTGVALTQAINEVLSEGE